MTPKLQTKRFNGINVGTDVPNYVKNKHESYMFTNFIVKHTKLLTIMMIY